MKRFIVLACVFLLGGLIFAQDKSTETAFWFGVDLSYVNEMDDCGAVYRVDDEAQDAFGLFADYGATLVRARLWHNPDWTDYSTLDDVKRTFQRAQDAGMATLLDFHYSDNWADPGRQEIPVAWEDITDTDELADTLYHYTYDVLSALHSDGLTPAFVQVGNETNSGMLKEEGDDLDWDYVAPLFNAGIRAVRDFSEETNTQPQIILHVAQPENTGWWFREAEAAGITDFDVIGVSYYPQWSTFSITEMGAHARYLKDRFGKDVMVVETAYGWTREAVDESADNILNRGVRGYSFSPEGQRRFMTDLTQSLISNGAIGVVYWEPAWVSTGCSTRWGQGSHWENATFFDFQDDNNVHEGINFLNHEYWFPVIADTATTAPLISDAPGDVPDHQAALDLHSLVAISYEDSLALQLTISGNIFDDEGNYLLYFDTGGDSAGATEDPGRRDIIAAAPYYPEYRLDIGVKDERGTLSGAYTWHRWLDDAWDEATYTGYIRITPGEESIIDLIVPLALIDNPEGLNLAVVSTPRGRASEVVDILGSEESQEDDVTLILDSFFQVAE